MLWQETNKQPAKWSGISLSQQSCLGDVKWQWLKVLDIDLYLLWYTLSGLQHVTLSCAGKPWRFKWVTLNFGACTYVVCLMIHNNVYKSLQIAHLLFFEHSFIGCHNIKYFWAKITYPASWSFSSHSLFSSADFGQSNSSSSPKNIPFR